MTDMTNVCEKCANLINGNSIQCGGFCSSTVCMRCSGVSDETFAIIKDNVHLVWMCTCCKNLLSKARFANSLVSVNKSSELIIDSLKTEIRESILAEIKSEIRSNFKLLANTVPRTPASLYHTPLAPPSRTKRLRENDGEDEAASRRPAKALCSIGTSTADTNLVASGTDEQGSNKFWLYLSGILPEVPESKVTELVESKLKTTDLRVVKLVPRGKDTRSFTFVSYKIGLPNDLKTLALASETWPRGIRFREFENLGNKNQFSWRPNATPVATPAEQQIRQQ